MGLRLVTWHRRLRPRTGTSPKLEIDPIHVKIKVLTDPVPNTLQRLEPINPFNDQFSLKTLRLNIHP